MTDREIIIYLAEKVMGWTAVEFDAEDRKKDNLPRLVEQAVRDTWWLRMHHDGPQQGMQWNPLENIADSFEVQKAVPEGKMPVYARELVIVTDAFMNARGSWELHRRDSLLIAATARQRCLAIVEATK